MAALPPGGETAVELQLSRDSRDADLGGRPTERVRTAEKVREGYTIIAFSVRFCLLLA